MARLTLSQKQQRVLVFLAGALGSRVFPKLRVRGFSEATHARGLDLLSATMRSRRAPSRELSRLHTLEELQRSWFPVVDATLDAHHPAVHAKVFAGLGQGNGLSVIIAMRELHARLEALRVSNDPEELAAWKVLEERGLSPAIVETIGKELQAAMTPLTAEEMPDDGEAELWRYYLEWSRIARTVVTDRRDLRTLGFLRGRKAEAEPEEVVASPQPAPVSVIGSPLPAMQNGASALPS